MQVIAYNEFNRAHYPDPNRVMSRSERIDAAYENIRKFMREALNNTAYVKIRGGARDGTIAIAELSTHRYLVSEKLFVQYRQNQSEMVNLNQYIRSWILNAENYDSFLHRTVYYGLEFDLRFDDGKVVTPNAFSYFYDVDDDESRGFDWLVDYTGPTVFKFTRKSAAEKANPKATFKDHLGQVVDVDDFVAYSSGNVLSVGKVSRLTKNGKSIYVRDYSDGNEVLITNSYRCILIDERTKTRAAMKKLSGD